MRVYFFFTKSLSLVQVIKKKNLQDCISTWYGKGQQSDLSVTLRWRDRWMVANDFLRFYALVREIVETIVTLFFFVAWSIFEL